MAEVADEQCRVCVARLVQAMTMISRRFRRAGDSQAFKVPQPTIESAPPTAPRVASALGTARMLMANWILRNKIAARCQLTVRNSTPST